MRSVIGVLVLTTMGATAASAETPAPDPDARLGQAFEACQKGQVESGVDLLSQLYAETQNLEYVVAQGRCLQKNGKANEALRYYREYLRIAKDATPEQRDKVLAYQKEAEDEARVQAPAPAATPALAPAPAAVPNSLPPAPPPAEPQPVSPTVQITQSPEPQPVPADGAAPLYRRPLFLIGAGAVVVAAVVTAVLLATSGGTTTAPLCTDCESTTGIGVGK
jgi:hypothetical protein